MINKNSKFRIINDNIFEEKIAKERVLKGDLKLIIKIVTLFIYIYIYIYIYIL